MSSECPFQPQTFYGSTILWNIPIKKRPKWLSTGDAKYPTTCVAAWDVKYLEVHNCVVCFPGYATFRQLHQLENIIHTPQNFLFGNEREVRDQS